MYQLLGASQAPWHEEFHRDPSKGFWPVRSGCFMTIIMIITVTKSLTIIIITIIIIILLLIINVTRAIGITAELQWCRISHPPNTEVDPDDEGYLRPVRSNEKHRAVAFPSSAQTCPHKRDRAWNVFLYFLGARFFLCFSTVRFLLLKMQHAMVVEGRILPHTCIHGILATTMPANLVEWVANISGWWYWTHHPRYHGQ